MASSTYVHRLCINKFSNIELDELEAMQRNIKCNTVVPDVTPDMSADSDKKKRDESMSQSRIWTKIKQRKDGTEPGSLGSEGNRTERSISWKPFYTTIFVRNFEKKGCCTRRNTTFLPVDENIIRCSDKKTYVHNQNTASMARYRRQMDCFVQRYAQKRHHVSAMWSCKYQDLAG